MKHTCCKEKYAYDVNTYIGWKHTYCKEKYAYNINTYIG